MVQRRIENSRVHFWTFSPVSVNNKKVTYRLSKDLLKQDGAIMIIESDSKEGFDPNRKSEFVLKAVSTLHCLPSSRNPDPGKPGEEIGNPIRPNILQQMAKDVGLKLVKIEDKLLQDENFALYLLHK